MHDPHHHHHTPDASAGYEATDMNTRLIIIVFCGLMVLMSIGLTGGMLVIRGFDESRTPMNTQPASPFATPQAQIPTGPLLQNDPITDRRKIIAEAEAQLNSYGWISQQPGQMRAHIPIETALQNLADGKVPYRQKPVAALQTPPATTTTPQP
jgi:hypothetical protein